jgi:hypothetical protein
VFEVVSVYVDWVYRRQQYTGASFSLTSNSSISLSTLYIIYFGFMYSTESYM